MNVCAVCVRAVLYVIVLVLLCSNVEFSVLCLYAYILYVLFIVMYNVWCDVELWLFVCVDLCYVMRYV